MAEFNVSYRKAITMYVPPQLDAEEAMCLAHQSHSDPRVPTPVPAPNHQLSEKNTAAAPTFAQVASSRARKTDNTNNPEENSNTSDEKKKKKQKKKKQKPEANGEEENRMSTDSEKADNNIITEHITSTTNDSEIVLTLSPLNHNPSDNIKIQEINTICHDSLLDDTHIEPLKHANYLNNETLDMCENLIPIPLTDIAVEQTIGENIVQFEEIIHEGSLQCQRDFLSSCISITNIVCRRVKNLAKPRTPNSLFSFMKNGHTRRIIKTFLLNTLGIAQRTLRTVIEVRSSETGIAPTDLRGRHGNQPKSDPEVLESVHQHINTVPRIESHYLRASREFIVMD
ncbi:unnamed protein product [Euphydryas editha]|uniref:Uncharacterized protein n=1 Tax=Euphydryas editha TaxID=104508 RepID=A0AAU9USB0_EUPED|nr:unnamed protein product [Euphydryas editha]